MAKAFQPRTALRVEAFVRAGAGGRVVAGGRQGGSHRVLRAVLAVGTAALLRNTAQVIAVVGRGAALRAVGLLFALRCEGCELREDLLDVDGTTLGERRPQACTVVVARQGIAVGARIRLGAAD